MKKIIVCLIISVCLIGCSEKPKFSINNRDDIGHYGLNKNSAIFTKVISADPKATAYKFTTTPESVFGIKTIDLDVIGGYVFQKDYNTAPSVMMKFKGKPSFDKLMERLKNLGNANAAKFQEFPSAVEKGNGIMMLSTDRKLTIMVFYDPFTNITTLSVINR